MQAFKDIYDAVERRFWNSLTKKLFSFMLLFVINLGYLAIWMQQRAAVDAALQAGLRDVVKDILDSLTPREAKVLRMRFGIEMTSDHTLEEVGKQFDVTRERIRQIEAKALRKLKHPSRSDKLRSFIDTL